MRAKWPVYVAVGAISVIAGTLIAGLPGGESSISDVALVETTVPQAGTTLASVVSEPPVPTTAPAAVTTTTATPVATTVAPTTVAPTTVAPTTVAPTTTAAASTTTAAPTTTAPTTTSTTSGGTAGLDERVDVAIVLANGDGRFNLVGRNRDRLLKLGYFIIDQQDVSDRPPATIIYFRPGFEDEAERLAGDLQTPNAVITELPDTPVTVNDSAGELVVVLGPDAIR